jgi:hypothetical protein
MGIDFDKFVSARTAREACSGNLKIWEPYRYLLENGRKPRKTSIEMACSVSVIQTSHLMLCSEIIAVCSEIHTKHKYTVL